MVPPPINPASLHPAEEPITRIPYDTGTAAGEVLTAAGALSEQAEQLSSEVNGFVAEVRAA